MPSVQQRPRPIPQRTCVACRETANKRGLVRIVRTPEGRVQVDLTGKANGRGAYLHESHECWQAALKKDRLAHALKATIAADDRTALDAHAAGYSAGQEQQTQQA